MKTKIYHVMSSFKNWSTQIYLFYKMNKYILEQYIIYNINRMRLEKISLY